ncbi:MAG: 50S ribosomal protein L4 [Nitrospirae bacterium]|nr:50S ribosomal protein L4 [Nitrospirota bacterium]
MEIPVINLKNEKKGTVALDPSIFDLPVNKGLIHEVVVMQQACMRQGTASTKTKGFVSGGGKKPWKQKGTGRARAGSIRSPLWRGGGTTFGPTPRDYSYTIPKKKVRLALCCLLAEKARDGEIKVLENWEGVDSKTKTFSQILDRLNLDATTLIVDGVENENLARSSANVSRVTLLKPEGLNVLDLIGHHHLVVTQQSLNKIVEVWTK